MVIVDGKQRLQALTMFLNNEIKVFDSYFKEYTDRLRIHRTLKINVNNLTTKKDVLQWYLEMNGGGTPHTESELSKVRKLIENETM